METYYIRLRLCAGFDGCFGKVLAPSKDALDKYIEKYLMDMCAGAYTEAYFYEVVMRRRKNNNDNVRIINYTNPVQLNEGGDPV